MSLTQHVIKNQKLRAVPSTLSPRRGGVNDVSSPGRDRDTRAGAALVASPSKAGIDVSKMSLKERKEKERQLEKKLKQQEQALKTLQDSHADESNIRLDERRNLSIQQKRQIEKHRNRYVKEGIRHKTEAQVQMELQEARKRREAVEAMQRTQEKRDERKRKADGIRDSLADGADGLVQQVARVGVVQQDLIKKIQGFERESAENRTNAAASVEEMSTGRVVDKKFRQSIEVKMNSHSQNASPLATYGSFSKQMSKNEHLSDFKSKNTNYNVRKFSITQIKSIGPAGGSPRTKTKIMGASGMKQGVGHHIGMTVQVNKTFQHHAGLTTHSSKKEQSINSSPDERKAQVQPKAPDYMKLQNVSSQSRLVGDGGLRKLMRRGTNADLDGFSPYKKRGAGQLHQESGSREKDDQINIIDQKLQTSGQKQQQMKKPAYIGDLMMDMQNSQKGQMQQMDVNQLINQIHFQNGNQRQVQIIDSQNQGQYGALDSALITHQHQPSNATRSHYNRDGGLNSHSGVNQKVQIVTQKYAAPNQMGAAAGKVQPSDHQQQVINGLQTFNQFIAFKQQLSDTGPKKQINGTRQQMPQFGIAPAQYTKMHHLPDMRMTLEHANSDLKDINSSLNKNFQGSENLLASMQNTSESFLQDVKELKVSGRGQKQQSQGVSFLSGADINAQYAMTIGQHLNSYHGQHQQALSPKPTKKILFQKQMNASQDGQGDVKSLWVKQSSVGAQAKPFVPSMPNHLNQLLDEHQMMQQHHMFTSIPERVQYEGVSGDDINSIKNQLNSGKMGAGVISPLDQSEHYTMIKHPMYAGMSDRFSQIELMKQSLYEPQPGAGDTLRVGSLKNLAFQTQPQIDQISHEHQTAKISLDGTGRETMLAGMMSRTGGHDNTLSLRQRENAHAEHAPAGHAPQPGNHEEQPAIGGTADANRAFGHKQSNKSLERESNTTSAVNVAANPQNKSGLYEAIEEESHVGRETADKTKIRSQAFSPKKMVQRGPSPSQELLVASPRGPSRTDASGNASAALNNSPTQSKKVSPLQKQKDELASEQTKQAQLSDREAGGSNLQQLRSSPLGLGGFKSQNRTQASNQHSPMMRKEKLSNLKKDQLNASMYNISPIEVYIEKRSAAQSNVFNAMSKQNSSNAVPQANSKQLHQSGSPRSKQTPSDGVNLNLQIVKISPKNVQSPQVSDVDNQVNVGQLQQQKVNQGSQQLQGSPQIMGNLNNPYLSYYKMRQENIQQQQLNKSHAQMQRNIQFQKQVQGQTSGGFQSTSIQKETERSNNTENSPKTNRSIKLKNEQSNHQFAQNDHTSRKALSNLNLEPKYKSPDQQMGETRAADPKKVAGVLTVPSAVHSPRNQPQIVPNNTTYLIKQAEMQASMELHELQEQTAEDNQSFQEGANRIFKGSGSLQKTPKKANKYSISNKQQMYIDKLLKNFSLYQAQGTKEVEKMLQYLYNKNQLSNTLQVLTLIGQLKNKQILKSSASAPNHQIQPEDMRELHDLLRTNPDVIALNLDKSTQEEIIETLTTLTKYVQEGKAHHDHLYLQNEAIKSKRNYEELFYWQRQNQQKQTYLEMLEKKMSRVDGMKNEELTPSDNLRPKYLDDQDKLKKRKQALTDLDYIKLQFTNKQNGIKVQKTRLEALLEKQSIVANSGGQQSIQIENTIEDETNQKIEDDNQIKMRLQKLLDKCFYFTSSAVHRKKKSLPVQEKPPERMARAGNTLTQGWEAWETETQTVDPGRTVIRDIEKSEKNERDYEIRMNPTVTKEEILPEEDELLQNIKERYLGIDEEHARRWKSKYKYLNLQNLQEIYISEQLEPQDRLDQALSAGGQRSMDNSIQYDVNSLDPPYDHLNPFDLPRNKLITSNSKASLPPNNIMPGGLLQDRDIRRRHQLIKPKKIIKIQSKKSIEATLQKNLSQKTIATLMTVQELDHTRKREMKKQEMLRKVQKEKKIDSETRFESKEENQVSNRQYGRLLEDQNYILPSLFDEKIAMIVSPESEIVPDSASKQLSKHREGNEYSSQVKEMITTQTLNLSNLRKLDREVNRDRNRTLTQQRLKNLHFSARTLQPPSPNPRVSALRAKQSTDYIRDLGQTRRLQAFSEQIQGPDADAPQTALYYRKDLSFIDKKLPELKIPKSLNPKFTSPVIGAPQKPKSIAGSPPVSIQANPFAVRQASASVPQSGGHASPIVQISQKEILQSFKQPIILKHPLRGPKFQLTPYAQYLSDQNNESKQREEFKKNFEAMSGQLREMFEGMEV